MKLVLLDRDGVINHESGEFVKDPEQWLAIPSSAAAIARLNRADIRVAVCTNQSGVGRGLMTEAHLASVHKTMEVELARAAAHLDGVYYCPHTPDSGCACRKPKAGLLNRAMQTFGVSAADTCFIGDSVRDLQAALAARCLPILVRSGNGQRAETCAARLGIANVFDDLSGAVDWILP